MPVSPTFPGVYIEEIPSGVRTITGVATSITAFLGRAARGPVSEPTTIFSFADFERQFGGLGVDYPMSYAVRDFYLNGGKQAIIVRLVNTPVAAPAPPAPAPPAPAPPGPAPAPPAAPVAKAAEITVKAIAGIPKIKPADLPLIAASPGEWGNGLAVTVNYKTREQLPLDPKTNLPTDLSKATVFNLVVYEKDASGNFAQQESFLNVSPADADPRYLPRVLKQSSSLVRVKRLADNSDWLPFTLPSATLPPDPKAGTKFFTADGSGAEGAGLAPPDFQGDQAQKTGVFALEKADLFNLLCIPPDQRDTTLDPSVNQTALQYCQGRRAMLIVDSPAEWSANKESAASNARDGLGGLGLSGDITRNAALYFPRVIEADPLRGGQLDEFVPCGIIAGVMATTDVERGVWKAPAGIDAGLNGIAGLNVNLTNDENGLLNPLGINCLRTFPIVGTVVWGARTLRGADMLADDYKYVPVRRLALFLEESLYRGTQWVVFEPNDEPLWAEIRLNVGAFMHNLFVQGAFQGQTPKDAYFVKCDKETTTQNDINLGIVNIVVGFAPLKPAEFVIIKVQQIAGDIQT
jgi:phage tail sheath protein FI